MSKLEPRILFLHTKFKISICICGNLYVFEVFEVVSFNMTQIDVMIDLVILLKEFWRTDFVHFSNGVNSEMHVL